VTLSPTGGARRRIAVLIATFLAIGATGLGSQEVVLEGARESPALRVLHEILERGQYLFLDRDTILPAEFRLDGDLVVWDALVRLEGEVTGDAAVIQGTFAVRPGARVGGRVAALDGLVLASRLAEVGEVVELPADQRLGVQRTAGVLRVELLGPSPVPRFGWGGVLGFRRLSFDRVDGWALKWGPQWRLVGREFGPRADAWVTLRTARRSPGGGVQLLVPVGARYEAVAGAERATRTNEQWVRGDLRNSAEAFLFGRDVRDYHESDRLWLRLGRPAADFVPEGGFDVAPYAEIRRSADRSLEPRRPWALTGRGQLARPNLPVAEVALLSVEAGAALAWQGASSSLAAGAALEHARPEGGEDGFMHWRLGGRWEMEALWSHTLTVAGHARGAFDTADGRPALPQRWSFVGGPGTLPSLPTATLRGDHVVFIGTEYRVPAPFVQVPFLGAPTLELLHATGTAWETGVPMPAWEQNLGLGVAFSFVRARAWTDPAADRFRPTLLVEVALP
jgi:hypothetical protein